MLLEHLAAHPATPAPLLEDLARYVTSQACPYRTAQTLSAALARNPQVPVQTVIGFLDHPFGGPVAHHLMRRPDVDADVALTALGTHTVVAYLASALRFVPDPDGRVVRHVTAARPTSVKLWTAALANTSTPTDVRDAGAAFLAGHAHLTGPARTAVVAHLLATLLRDPAAGAALHATLTARAATDDMRHDLAAIDPSPTGMADRWLADPATDPARVIAHARAGRRTSGWRTVLATYPDPDGVVAQAAWQTCPDDLHIQRLLLRSDRTPMAVRLAAMDALCARGDSTGPSSLAVQDLLRTGPLDWLRRHLATHHHLPEVAQVMVRDDLTTEDVELLHSTRTRALAGMSTSAPRVTFEASPVGQAHWLAFLATHPRTGAGTRRIAATRLAGLDGDDYRMATYRAIGAATADLDPADPASVVRAGGQLPASLTGAWSVTALPGVRWLVGAALADLAPTLTGAQMVSVLTYLTEQLPKEATLEDVLTSAAAVTS